MAGLLLLQIRNERIERGAVVDQVPAAPPIEITGDALADQIAPARPGQRAEVDVGEMGEGERHPTITHSRLISRPRTPTRRRPRSGTPPAETACPCISCGSRRSLQARR